MNVDEGGWKLKWMKIDVGTYLFWYVLMSESPTKSQTWYFFLIGLTCHWLVIEKLIGEIHGPTMENPAPQWHSGQGGCWLQLDALDLMRPDLLGAPSRWNLDQRMIIGWSTDILGRDFQHFAIFTDAKKWSSHPLKERGELVTSLSHQATRSSRDQAGIKQESRESRATPGPHHSVLDGQKDSKRSGSEHHDHPSPLEMETSNTFKQWKSLWSSRI